MADGPPDLQELRHSHLSRQPVYALAMILPQVLFLRPQLPPFEKYKLFVA